MSGGAILIAGKALLWFALPLAFAWWDLRSLARERRRREATARAGEPAAQSKKNRAHTGHAR